MTTAAAPEVGAPTDSISRLKASVHDLRHWLPAQAPLRDFVHHNTLHAFQHLSFPEALATAARLTGARPWLAEERCCELFRQGRINAHDLDAAWRQIPEAHPDEVLFANTAHALRRGDILRTALLYHSTTVTPTRLRWLAEETGAFARLPADLDPETRRRLLAAAQAEGLDETAAVADLWSAAQSLSVTVPIVAPSTTDGANLWRELLGRIGRHWTIADLLRHLTGEDLRDSLQPLLIRHCSAHLDRGIAAWTNPARAQGFYAAWRTSAGRDLSWELDELAWARHDIARLPKDPWRAMAQELLRLGVDESCWGLYLQRLALELPGWAGMCHWRETHLAPADPPVCLHDFLAVRLVLERLHAEQLVRRVWDLPLQFAALAAHFSANPGELALRHAFGNRSLSEEMLAAVSPLLVRSSGEADGRGWARLSARLSEPCSPCDNGRERRAMAAWPLFVLALRLGWCGRELRTVGPAGAAELLSCANAVSAEQRNLVWLVAYEHHYRQQIFGALLANHGRAQPDPQTSAAQFVLCMDDREEGTRRHLEEVNPAFETFGAAGFFGVPILWHGLDDEAPTALCPIVVRPNHVIHETVAPGAEKALDTHRKRRRLRVRWLGELHQGSRRGWLRASLYTTVAGPIALLGLLGRTLAPGRLGALLGRWRNAFDTPLTTELQLTAKGEESVRAVDAERPRVGFSEMEQAALVGGFLRTIGLTQDFAPLVIVVGHGSDSRNNPHLAAYDCGACSGRHGGANARVFAAMANRREVRAGLAAQGIRIPEATYFIGAEHNTCDESVVWYDESRIPISHRDAFAALRRDCAEATRLHAVERCRRFASAPRGPSPLAALQHLANRRQDLGQARPELGHATVAAAFVGRRTMSRGAFFDRRVFLISYDPVPDTDGRVLEATLLATGPVGAGINLEYYFSTVDNEGFGCGSKILHNLAGLFGVMQGTASDLRTGLPLQMIEIHEPMRLLVIVEQELDIVTAIYQRQPPLQELIGNGWILLAAKHPEKAEIHFFDPTNGWQAASADLTGAHSLPASLPEVERSVDWFAGHRGPLPPVLLRRPRVTLGHERP